MPQAVDDDSLAPVRRRAATVARTRIVAVCAALTAFAVIQSPGLILADSKTDLTANPVAFLARALHLWNPSGTFGELQNQAYGYLWPMGPFFAAGDALGIPAWVVERAWWALLLCVAFTGLVALANRLRIGTPAARLVAGVAFALSPRLLAEVGYTSVEAWPTALAPWVLVPLIGLARGAPIRRAVALSAVAVACAGGVNATAVFAVVPLPLLWLTTLAPARRRIQATAAWCAAVLAATAWWLVPLLVLGRYSPPFLDYIESADVTTRFTDVVTNLRGASYWVAYLGGPFGAALPAGWTVSQALVPVIASIVLAAVGIVGLSRAGMPHRRFLVVGLLIGVALVGLGHVSDLDTAVAGPLRTFLDGVGSPLRNVHKFDVVIRIPLLLGLAHVVGLVLRLGSVVRGGWRPRRGPALLAAGVVLAAVAGIAVPAAAAGLGSTGGYAAIPSYWRDASRYLDAHLGRDRVLVVPGASFATYGWGNTADEITQSLLRGDWAVRNAIPLAPPTTIRLLDAVESTLATGAGSTGLAAVLARSGVRYVLLRSDLDVGPAGAVSPVVARQALDRSPGLTRVTTFGAAPKPDRIVDDGLAGALPPLELYQVDQRVDAAALYDAASVSTVVGGPESLLDLAAAGQLPAAPTVLAGDLAGRTLAGPVVLTDGLRRRDVGFGGLHDNASATLTADQPFDTDVPAHDYLPAWGAGATTTARYEGVSEVSASSSWSQARLAGGTRPEYQPFAAVDGDPRTSWRPAPGTADAGQWLELRLDSPQVITSVKVHFDLTAGTVPTSITVTAGSERASASGLSAELDVTMPGRRPTRTVRITVTDSLGIGNRGGGFGVSEVDIPGLHAVRTLVVPPAPASTARPVGVVLSAAPTTPACFFTDDVARCSPVAQRGSEDGAGLDRTLTLPIAGTYTPRVWARPRPGAELDAVIDREVATARLGGLAPAVTATSTYLGDPAGRPGAVLDGNPSTVWQPELNDTSPLLRLTWLTRQTITGLRFTTDPGVAATRLGTVRVVGDDGVRGGFLDAEGTIRFDPPLHTDDLSIVVLDQPTARTYDSRTNSTRLLPVAIGEVQVLPGGAGPAADLDSTVDLGCGSGPTLSLGSGSVRTRLVATRRDLVELREVPAQLCDVPAGGVALDAGEVRVIATASGVATATRVALAPVGRVADDGAALPLTVGTWTSTERRLTIAAAPAERILAVRENTNAGWVATVDGQSLAPVVLDGWQQGYVVPAGVGGEVVLRFAPDTAYRAGLLGGAFLLLVVVLLAVLPSRRRGGHALPPVGRRSHSRALPLAAGAAALVSVGGLFGGGLVLVAVLSIAFRTIVPYRPRPAARLLSRRLQTWLPVAAFVVAGWSAVADDTHRAVGPQAAGLVAVAALWVSTILRPRTFAATPAETGHYRLLHEVVARRRQDEPPAQRDGERGDGIPGEQRPVGGGVQHFDDQQMPQEQSVRDRP